MRATLAALIVLIASQAFGQAREVTLTAPQALIDSGVLRHMLPRFTLKHRVRVTVVAGEDLTGEAHAGMVHGDTGRLVFRWAADDRAVRFQRAEGLDGEHAEWVTVFEDWLTSDVGENTLAAFNPDGAQMFLPGAEAVAIQQSGGASADTAAGEKLAFFHCGRCHVINKKNKYGGIGSTPSFGALRALPDWHDRFSAFWTLNPHPAFTQVDGITEPFHESRPPAIAPVELTLEEVEQIVEFATSIPAKDLGKGVQSR